MGKIAAHSVQSATRSPKTRTPHIVYRTPVSQPSRLLTSCKCVSCLFSIGTSSGFNRYCSRPTRHDKLTSLAERKFERCWREKCRPIDTVGSDSNSHEWAHSTSVYLFIFCISIYFHCAQPASCFSSFLGISKKKKTHTPIFSRSHCQGKTSRCLPPSNLQEQRCNSIQHLFAISVVN